MTVPTTGPCARCRQPCLRFPADPKWKGTAPTPLCLSCWGRYAEARKAGSYVDWTDALTNATDDEIARQF